MKQQTVGIVDYGLSGNIHSIQKALTYVGGNVQVIASAEELSHIDKIVIPGVGSFVEAMRSLHQKNLFQSLQEHIRQKPCLGICLGMQILATVGFEYGVTPGLDAIKAEVRPILTTEKVPHMGFNSLEIVKTNPLFKGIEAEEFYFMHSYEVVNYTDVATLTDYAGHKFVSSVNKDNLYGVQFHPEKSRDAGLSLFQNYLNI